MQSNLHTLLSLMPISTHKLVYWLKLMYSQSFLVVDKFASVASLMNFKVTFPTKIQKLTLCGLIWMDPLFLCMPLCTPLPHTLGTTVAAKQAKSGRSEPQWLWWTLYEKFIAHHRKAWWWVQEQWENVWWRRKSICTCLGCSIVTFCTLFWQWQNHWCVSLYTCHHPM